MKKKHQVLLALALFAGMQLQAQTTTITTGVDDVTSGMIPYFVNDDSWTVQRATVNGTSAFTGVKCCSGWVETGGCVAVPSFFIPTGAHWLSPYTSPCTSGSSFVNGAHLPWTPDWPDSNTVYTYKRTFEVTRCGPDSVAINLSWFDVDDNSPGSFYVNGHPYAIPGTPLPWHITVLSSHVFPGTNILELTVPNSAYNTGMGLMGTISVYGGTTVGAGFALQVSGGVLTGYPNNPGAQTWEVYGSNSGASGTYAYVGTYYTDPLSIAATMKCYYVKHTLAFSDCSSQCESQAICSSNCEEGPNPCSLEKPKEVRYNPSSHKCEWTAVSGAVSYILQIMPNDPDCCGDQVVLYKPINIPLFGTSHTINFYHDLGVGLDDEEPCFSMRVIPVCESGSTGTPSDKLCSNGSAGRPAGNTATGIASNTNTNKGSSLNIVPNPVSGMVSFQVETITEGNLVITVTDIAGKTVRTFSNLKTVDKHATLNWNTEELPKGTYLVKIVTPDGQTLNKKLLVN